MPIYEYECEKCGKIVEAFQDINDKPLKKCDCGDKGKLKRIISLSTFQLKGNVWYSTDYAKRPGIPPEAKEKGAETVLNPKGEGSSKSSGDSKSAGSEAASD